MSVAGPAVWRTPYVRLTVPPLRQSCLLELTPLRHWSQLQQSFLGNLPRVVRGILPQLQCSRFSTAVELQVGIGLSRTRKPLPSQDPNKLLQELPLDDVRKVFNDSISAKRGKKLLQQLQEQRALGTLDEGIPGETADATDEALAWLRTNIPYDEDAAIEARLDREEEEELGLVNPQVTSDYTIQEPLPRDANLPPLYVPQQHAYGNQRGSKSVVEEIREKNLERQKLEAEAKVEAEKKAKTEGVKTGFPTAYEEKRLARQIEGEKRRNENLRWKKEQIGLAQGVFGKEEGEFPKLAPWQRLWPSTLMTVGVLCLSLVFAHFYTPSPPQGRIWPDISPATATMVTLVAVNVLVHFAWFVVPLQMGMYKRFVVVPGYPRAIGIIGNIFSHHERLHLIMNMIALWIFGTRCESPPTSKVKQADIPV